MNITIRPDVESAIRSAGIMPLVVAGLVEQWLMASGGNHAAVSPTYTPTAGTTSGTVRHPSLRSHQAHAVNDYILGRTTYKLESHAQDD